MEQLEGRAGGLPRVHGEVTIAKGAAACKRESGRKFLACAAATAIINPPERIRRSSPMLAQSPPMSWKEKAVSLYRRFGSPVKFAAKLVVGAVVPGGSAVVALVDAALDCVHETIRGPDRDGRDEDACATAADLQRLEGVLDILSGNLGALTAQMAAIERLPEVAKQQLDVALATDDRCRAALGKLDELAKGFDVLRRRNTKILKGQGYAAGMLEEMLPLMRRMAGVADYVEELHAARVVGVRVPVAPCSVPRRPARPGQGRIAEAKAKLSEASQARPNSGAAAVALAAVQAAGHDLAGAEQSLGEGRAAAAADAEPANCIAASRRSAVGRRRKRSRAGRPAAEGRGRAGRLAAGTTAGPRRLGPGVQSYAGR